ncbi:MAG: hypothetical protein RRY16_02360 [Bacilli bacterium]
MTINSQTSNNIDLKNFFEIYKLMIADCTEDSNKYNITIDYNNNTFYFVMTNRDTLEVILSKRCQVDLITARNTIELIRNDFISNHRISLPGINRYNLELPNLKCSYIMCHHIQNTKFDLLITIRNEYDRKMADIAQNYALNKKYDDEQNKKKTFTL